MSIALRRRRSAGGVNAFETAHSSSGRLFPVGITAATTTCDKFIYKEDNLSIDTKQSRKNEIQHFYGISRIKNAIRISNRWIQW